MHRWQREGTHVVAVVLGLVVVVEDEHLPVGRRRNRLGKPRGRSPAAQADVPGLLHSTRDIRVPGDVLPACRRSGKRRADGGQPSSVRGRRRERGSELAAGGSAPHLQR
jgi:hypothetical protein